ncbi:MAG: putative DNA binding domain-containing protein [Proteobacteria bacterium]|nr:putative DNA binding domain-containing protein [Pseudomonadota bacterium]
MKNLNLKTVFVFAFVGILIGVFVLHPLTMVIYWLEYNLADALGTTVFEFVLMKMTAAFYGKMFHMSFLFAGIGIALGLVFWLFHRNLSHKERLIDSLSGELERDISLLIKNGETETLEFKSSARWDFRQQKINKALELVIVKTIAGFMNYKGGTLLIGIDDDGIAVGLEQDYKTLKKKNSDGYEQLIVALVSTHLGTDLCQNINVVFQRVEDKDVCRVIVSPAQRPAFEHDGNKTCFFLRTGGATRELNIQEATEYIAGHWQ